MVRRNTNRKPPRKAKRKPHPVKDRHQRRLDADDARHAELSRDLVKAHRRGLVDLREATKYRPGSPEKVAVLAARYSIGMRSLHAAGDINHNVPACITGTTLPLDKPLFIACRVHEVAE